MENYSNILKNLKRDKIAAEQQVKKTALALWNSCMEELIKFANDLYIGITNSNENKDIDIDKLQIKKTFIIISSCNRACIVRRTATYGSDFYHTFRVSVTGDACIIAHKIEWSKVSCCKIYTLEEFKTYLLNILTSNFQNISNELL